MIRLTVRCQTPQESILQIDGRVSGKGVGILEREGTRLLGESQRLVLDLKGVRFIDAAGLALLKRWSGDRLVLRNGRPFVQLLLETHGLA